jgi:Transposase/Transposase IS116/IS110/IS902 family
MAEVMIGIDPHESSHTAVAIGLGEEPLGELQVRACPSQAGQLLAWAREWPERAWAIEGAAGLGCLPDWQLAGAGERVLDVPPKLAARVRLLASGNTSKNDPDDACSVAVAALRSKAWRPVVAEDHAVVLKIWAKRHRDLARARNQACCRLHAVLCDLVPGGIGREISAGKAGRLSLRGNRRVNHAIHMAAISQIRHKRSDGRAYYDKKMAEGKTHKEAPRALKRRISDAIYAALVADARQAICSEGPGGQPGNHSASRAAGSHPARRLFGAATPGPRHHTTAAAGTSGRAGHSPIAAALPPAKPQVQVERPQRSEDERPGGAARRRPYPAARKAPTDPPTASEAPASNEPQDNRLTANSKEDSIWSAT